MRRCEIPKQCSIMLLALVLCEAVFHPVCNTSYTVRINITHLYLCHLLISCPHVAAGYIVRRKPWCGLKPQSTLMSSSTQDLNPQLHLGKTFGALFIGVIFAAMLVTYLLAKFRASSIIESYRPNIFHGTVSLV
jgi:hypothetical protein